VSGSLTIRGCTALERAGGEPLGPVDIVIDDGRISALAAADRRAAEANLVAADRDSIDGRGLLAIPGLVNAHTHSPENPLRGVGEGLALEPWLALMFTASGRYSPEDHYQCARAGAVEMLRTGTTAVVDHLWMTGPSTEAVDATLRAYRDIGIRAAVAPLMSDCDYTEDLARGEEFSFTAPLLPVARPSAAECAAILEDVMGRWHGTEGGRLQVLAGPGGVQWSSDELLTELARVAERHQSTVHIHLLESWLQDRACRLRFGASAVAGLDALGVLGQCSLAHSVWLDNDDIELIAERGAAVVHNPAANLRLGSGRARIRELLDAGVPVGLGTDGAASSDNQVMWDTLKLAALIHNDVDERWVVSADALKMATTGGAAVLGRPGELGVLAPGALADITLLDEHGDGLAGWAALNGALALSETGSGVRHVIVDGHVVVRDCETTRVDAAETRAALAEQAARRRPAFAAAPAAIPAVDQLLRLRAALRPDPKVLTQFQRGGNR